MNIDFRPLNKGETYCCSLKRVKELFKDTRVSFYFTHGGKEFSKGLQHPIYRYANKNVKGVVLCYVTMNIKQEDPLFCFFGVSINELSRDLVEEFEKTYLPKFYNSFIEMNNNQNLTSPKKLMLVELIDGKLKLHETALTS